MGFLQTDHFGNKMRCSCNTYINLKRKQNFSLSITYLSVNVLLASLQLWEQSEAVDRADNGVQSTHLK